MHIILNGWFWRQLDTGSGQYLHALVEHLPQVAPQHSYTLIQPRVSTDLGDATRQLPSLWQTHVAATPCDRCGDNLAKLWFEQVSFPRLCRRLGADIALTPYWGAPAWQPCRHAVTVHDLIPLLLPAYRGGLPQRLYTRLVRWTARRAAIVLTDSQASRQDIIARLGIPAARVHAVLLAADARFRPVTAAADLQRVRQSYGLPDRFVLYLGGFDVRKNVARLVQAYAQWARRELARYEVASSAEIPPLVIAGRLPVVGAPFTPDPRRMVAAANIADHVHFTGWIAEADKPALYSLASALLFPSLYEGFGLPVAEAAACGVPVVTSDRSALPEVTADAILVDPEDVDSIAAALEQALHAPRRPSTAARRTWAHVAAETMAVLEDASFPARGAAPGTGRPR